MIRKWTTSETEFLLKYRQNYSLSSMAFKLKRSETAIINKINSLGHTWRRKHCKLPYQPWSSENKRFLIINYNKKISVKQIARKLNRTPDAVWGMIGAMSLWRQTAKKRSTPPIFSLTNVEAAYIAGIIDGEGSFTINFTWTNPLKPKINLSLHITNTDLELIQWLKNKLKVHRKYTALRATSAWLAVYTLIISQRAHLEQIIRLILPYLKVKKKASIHFLELMKLFDQQTPKLKIIKKIIKFKESLNTRHCGIKNSIKLLKNRIKNLQLDT